MTYDRVYNDYIVSVVKSKLKQRGDYCLSYQLRDYQHECVDIMTKAEKGERILISIATGGGKTVIFSTYAINTSGRTLIVVPSTELREQSIQKLRKIDPDIDVGSVQGSINEVSNKVVVATRQSLTHSKSKRIDEMLKHGKFESIIFDEVHQACEQVIKIINKIKDKNVKIFGVTATPWNRQLNKIFTKINYQKTILDMILDEYLCEPKAMMVQSTTSLMDVKSVAGEFNQKDLEETVDNPLRNRLIVKSYQEFASERKSTLVFCVGIDHLNHVVEEFKSEGIYCKGLDSTYSKEDRKSIIEEFKSGKLPVLVNCGVLTTGFDHEAVDCIILARPTKSRILYTQIIGRGLRLHPDKNDCLIIDINDVVRTHDLLNMSSVFEMPIKHGETPKRAIERIKKEKENEERRKQEEEERRIERERLKQEELKIKVQQIKLFNRDMKSRMEEAKYDWWRADNLTWVLTYAMNVHYAVENVEDNYNIYNVVTEKDKKYAELITCKNSIIECIEYVEKRINKNTYTDKNSEWKFDQPTDGQRKYCGWAKTKWEAACYFSGSNIRNVLKKCRERNTG